MSDSNTSLLGGCKVENLRYCLNCKESSTAILTCSGCKVAQYCSKECQKQDWKRHKPHCKSSRATRKAAKESGTGRETRLLNQWLVELQSGQDLYLAVLALASKGRLGLYQVQPPTHLIMLDLMLDWNIESFIPLRPPYLIPLSQMTQDVQKFAQESHPHDPGVVVQCICARLRTVLVHSRVILSRELPRITLPSFSDLCDAMAKNLSVSSSVFAKYKPMRKVNLKNQLDAIQKSPVFQKFLAAAFQCYSPTPLHKSHNVKIHVLLGEAPGEICNISSFSIHTTGEVHERTNNGETSAIEKGIGAMAIQPGCNTETELLVATLDAAGKSHGTLRIGLDLDLDPQRAPQSVAESKQEAAELFEQVKKIKLPAIQSPRLGE